MGDIQALLPYLMLIVPVGGWAIWLGYDVLRARRQRRRAEPNDAMPRMER